MKIKLAANPSLLSTEFNKNFSSTMKKETGLLKMTWELLEGEQNLFSFILL